MLANKGRQLSELTAEELDELLQQKNEEMRQLREVNRRDSSEINSTHRRREFLKGKRSYLKQTLKGRTAETPSPVLGLPAYQGTGRQRKASTI
jgi:chromosome segregation ATPase